MVYGYSERGIFNSIIYYLDSKPELIGEFLEKLGVEGFSNGKYDFTFLNEQSFSDFGDSDLTIIVKQNKTNKKAVIFIEGKRGEKFLLANEYKKLEENRKRKPRENEKKKFYTSNLFIQLYLKYLLSKGRDVETIDDSLKELIGKPIRKIGTNKVVLEARDNYIKDAEEYYYVAIMPKQAENSKTIREYFKDLNLLTDVIDNIRYAFWQNIETFFVEKKAINVINNFKYNKTQIY